MAHLSDRFGLERLGFLTLTFADHVLDPAVAQRRLNSLATGVLNDRYPAWLRVFERQKSGRIHYHLLVAVGFDVRSGCDFEAFARRDYRSAPLALRAEWAFWRRIASRYGFGRTELLPIRSTVEAASRYVGKYIGKHLEARQKADKGVRLVSYSKGARMARTRFSWSDSGRPWRLGVEAFADLIARQYGISPALVRAVGLSKIVGPRWAFDFRPLILELGAAALQDDETASEG